MKYITTVVFSFGCLYVAVNHSEGLIGISSSTEKNKTTRKENKKETN